MIPVNDLKRINPDILEELQSKAAEVIKSGWFVLGKEVSEFESEFSSKLGISYCIGVDNGLNAIKLGIQSLGIGPGDEVIVQANTYIATVLGITWNGATPIFVEPNEYFNLDSTRLESALSENTKAVLVTHLYGQSSGMDEIVAFCDDKNLFLIEDCAQSHFSQYQGRNTGTFGDLGFFSFYPTKNLGAIGDAGCIVTNSYELSETLKKLRNYGSTVRYQNELLGHNARLDEIQAAFLRVKLRHIDMITQERSKIATRYNNEIVNPNIIKPRVVKNATHVWHLYVIQVQERDKFRTYLREHGINSDIHYPIPPHLSKAYSYLGYKEGDFPITEMYAKTVVSLPLFNGLNEKEINHIIEVVNSYE